MSSFWLKIVKQHFFQGWIPPIIDPPTIDPPTINPPTIDPPYNKTCVMAEKVR